ncbi:TetR/AcrR family transcriptional regulator [Hoeflea prorocentri]|uniref:TetR/AcrR family transcriptional regulator n=1 Tax=Hoeflea prorocentri TaxID=1922333 RepID=A0A9X3ZHF3_9HYPH|nr:TetR/AcrR family transcriptional regulator [Hoeflea prorocentri]MCY6380700.1 TetR/AcrR family transcriptional regulator [Hoeflea prorocentri]MDA5398500.1 TetR/AcrR family transcriptional regulator [Hoeflea prorocentri]
MARTKALDYDEKRGAILQSAAKLFADVGYDRSSMSQLAEACGVSKALLYHYYSGKDALLYDVIGSHLKELCLTVEAADRPDAEPEERIYLLITALLNAYREADHEHKVQINEMKHLPHDQQEALKDLERRLVTFFAQAVRGINPDLEARLVKPVTMSLFGMLNWHYMWFRPQGGVGREEYAEMASRLIVSGTRGLT